MQRDGIDHEHATMEDFLCDFCRRAWTDDRPMVEGHQGACVCGDCLTIAFLELLGHRTSSPVGPEETCSLCRETRDDPHWRSPVYDEAIVCRRCVKQASGVLHKDRDIAWSKPPLTDPAQEG